MSFSQSWLENSSSIKKIFAIVTVFNKSRGQDEQLFLSNALYSIPAAGIYFTPCLGSNLNFTERVQITPGAVNIDNGTLELLNYSGELDSWLDSNSYVWYNRPIKIYVGDPTWTTTDVANFEATFKLVFKGIVEDIDGTDQNRLGLKLRSLLAKLNASISELTLEGEGDASTVEDLSQKFAPIILGEVFNIQPQLTSPADLKYILHKAPGTSSYKRVKGVIEIRDNGIPLYTESKGNLAGWYTGSPGTVSPLDGCFTLGAQPAGTITCSVQGDNRVVNLLNGTIVDDSTSYTNNVYSIIALILMAYGTPESRLSPSEINWNSFAVTNYVSGGNSSVGLYINSRDNILPILQKLAESSGVQIVAGADGVVKLVKLGSPSTDTNVISDITPDDILANSFSVASRPEVVAAVKLGYCKTWYKQADISASQIPEEHKDLVKTEYMYVTAQDPATATLYKLPLDVEPTDTYLINEAQAAARAQEILDYFKVQKTVYKFKGVSKLMQLNLGQFVNITHPRFGFAAGKQAQVVSLTYNYADFSVDVEVIR